jgi:RND family efflux transporter MFP subunit
MAQGQIMTKRKYWLLLAVGGMFFAGFLLFQSPRTPAVASRENGSDETGRVIAETAVLESAANSSMTRTFSGLIKATRTSELGFKRGGRVEAILVQNGQKVKQGELLARLDVQQTLADLDQARASLQAAEAQLAEALAGPRAETIAAARAQVADTESEVKLWSARVARQKELQQSGAVSAQEFDDSRFQLEAVVNRRDRFQRQLDELLAGTRVEQIAVFRAGVAQWTAAVARLEVEVEDSYLKAPYDALVAKRHLDEGVVVPPGTALVRLLEHQEVEAWVGLPSDYIVRLPESSSYPIQIEGRSYRATVRDVLPEVDLATRTRTAVFTVVTDKDATELPIPGQMFRLSLHRNEPQDGFWIPITALARGQRGLWSVLIVSPIDQKIERRDVELMQVDSNRVLVRGLIEAGERYVTTGLHRLTPGQKVEIASAVVR